jgi:hypothetical protein
MTSVLYPVADETTRDASVAYLDPSQHRTRKLSVGRTAIKMFASFKSRCMMLRECKNACQMHQIHIRTTRTLSDLEAHGKEGPVSRMTWKVSVALQLPRRHPHANAHGDHEHG